MPCCPECWNCQGCTKPAMCYSLVLSTALYSPQGGGQHRVFSGRNNFLSFFSLWTNIIWPWLTVLEGFQNKVMCSVWDKHASLVDSHCNSSIWKRRLQFPLWQESLGDVLWPVLCKKSDWMIRAVPSGLKIYESVFWLHIWECATQVESGDLLDASYRQLLVSE